MVIWDWPFTKPYTLNVQTLWRMILWSPDVWRSVKIPLVTIMIHVCKSKAWLAQIGKYLLRLLCIKNPAGTNVSGFWCGIHRWFEILFYCTLISFFYLCNEEPLTSIVHLSQSGEWHSGWVHPNGVGQFWFNCLSCCIHFKLDANISLHQLLMYSLSYFSLWNLIKCTLFYLSGSMILVVSQGKRIKDLRRDVSPTR